MSRLFLFSQEKPSPPHKGDVMKPNMKDSTQLLITFTTSMAAAIGSCAGATIWQSFGKPKVEEIAEKNSKPKRKIGFSID